MILAPFYANSMAVDCPIPESDPVINAAFPVNFIFPVLLINIYLFFLHTESVK